MGAKEGELDSLEEGSTTASLADSGSSTASGSRSRSRSVSPKPARDRRDSDSSGSTVVFEDPEERTPFWTLNLSRLNRLRGQTKKPTDPVTEAYWSLAQHMDAHKTPQFADLIALFSDGQLSDEDKYKRAIALMLEILKPYITDWQALENAIMANSPTDAANYIQDIPNPVLGSARKILTFILARRQRKKAFSALESHVKAELDEFYENRYKKSDDDIGRVDLILNSSEDQTEYFFGKEDFQYDSGDSITSLHSWCDEHAVHPDVLGYVERHFSQSALGANTADDILRTKLEPYSLLPVDTVRTKAVFKPSFDGGVVVEFTVVHKAVKNLETFHDRKLSSPIEVVSTYSITRKQDVPQPRAHDDFSAVAVECEGVDIFIDDGQLQAQIIDKLIDKLDAKKGLYEGNPKPFTKWLKSEGEAKVTDLIFITHDLPDSRLSLMLSNDDFLRTLSELAQDCGSEEFKLLKRFENFFGKIFPETYPKNEDNIGQMHLWSALRIFKLWVLDQQFPGNKTIQEDLKTAKFRHTKLVDELSTVRHILKTLPEKISQDQEKYLEELSDYIKHADPRWQSEIIQAIYAQFFTGDEQNSELQKSICSNPVVLAGLIKHLSKEQLVLFLKNTPVKEELKNKSTLFKLIKIYPGVIRLPGVLKQLAIGTEPEQKQALNNIADAYRTKTGSRLEKKTVIDAIYAQFFTGSQPPLPHLQKLICKTPVLLAGLIKHLDKTQLHTFLQLDTVKEKLTDMDIQAELLTIFPGVAACLAPFVPEVFIKKPRTSEEPGPLLKEFKEMDTKKIYDLLILEESKAAELIEKIDLERCFNEWTPLQIADLFKYVSKMIPKIQASPVAVGKLFTFINTFDPDGKEHSHRTGGLFLRKTLMEMPEFTQLCDSNFEQFRQLDITRDDTGAFYTLEPAVRVDGGLLFKPDTPSPTPPASPPNIGERRPTVVLDGPVPFKGFDSKR